MKGNEFIFDCVQLLCWKGDNINLKLGGSCIDSPDPIKNKKQR